MTPKEKAEKLVDKMYYSRRYDNTENYIPDKAWEHAKQCALIAADELIKYCHAEHIGYWQEVRKEIEKL